MQMVQPSTRPYSPVTADVTYAVLVLADTIEDSNLQACRLWGYGRDALMGKTLQDLSPEMQADGSSSLQTLKARIQATQAGLPQSFEWQFRRADGELFDSLISLEAVAINGHSCLVCRVRDLTYLHQAESALRESETRLQQILNNTTAVVYVKDRQGRHLLVNKQFEHVFQRREADVLGKTDYDVFPPRIAENFRCNDLQVLEKNAPMEFEETAQLADGDHTYLSIKFPLFNTEGEAYAVCGISTDITERKRTEEALRNVALGVSGAIGSDIFKEIVCYLTVALGVDCAFIGKLIKGSTECIRTLAVYDRGQFLENIEYDLAGTPCEHVVGKQFEYIPTGAPVQYPGDPMLQDMHFDSYAAYPLFDSQGKALGLIAATDRKPLRDRDVAEAMLKIFSVRAAAELERLRTDEARRISEESYRAIFEASEDAIFIHDFDTGAIVDVNPKACQAYGYSYEEMKQVDAGVLSSGEHPYTLAQAAKLIEQAKAGKPLRFEWHRRNKDGSLHWDEVVLKRATIAGVERILAFTREITSRKEREAALQRSEERLRATVEAAFDSIIGMDGQGNVIEFNPAAEHCFGYRRAEVLGKSLAELIIPERYREAHQQGLANYHEAGKGPFLGRRIEIEAVRSDGSEFPIELAIDVVRGPKGNLFIGYLRDITERKQAEAERVRLETQLRQAQKMEAIGHLTGGIAHDFNNILTGVMGYVVLATERAEQVGDAKLTRYLERAYHSGQRARDLIQQMLTFSRGQRGEPRPLSLGPLIKESIKLLSSTLPSSIEFHMELDTETPPVMLDPVQVEQILMNLCINARDAMAGRGRIELRLHRVTHPRAVCASCHQTFTGSFVEIAVRDTGPGISPEHLERIFEPFFTTKETGKGSGMGLSTVHGIVHEYGGHIVIDTAPGKGAEFQVLFRALAPAQVGTALSFSSEDEETTGKTSTLRGRVLVVDDDEVVGDFMEDLLASWGLEVRLIRNSIEARDVFAEDPQRFDLAVLDQTMPRMTGLELAKHLLTLRTDLPVILYTGYSENLSEAQIRSAGIHALVKKPVATDKLYTLVGDLLSATAAR